ncbi:ATP-grasp domain-containing protein [Streptomyces sp. NPDC054871]
MTADTAVPRTMDDGLLTAAHRMGVPTVLLSPAPDMLQAAYAHHPYRPAAVEHAPVGAAGPTAARIAVLGERYGAPTAVLTNDDRWQTSVALIAQLLGLPGKSPQAALRCKNKLLTRRTLAQAGLDEVAHVYLGPGDDPAVVAAQLPFPAVVKPCEGVSTEDVWRVQDLTDLTDRVAHIRSERADVHLMAEEFLTGALYTYDTLGDGSGLYHFSSWRCTLSAPPWTTTLATRDWDPHIPAPVEDHLRAQLSALGVGFGACHTEFVIDGDRARVVEVNYRLPGLMEFLCGRILDLDLFTELVRLHLGGSLPAHLPDIRRLQCAARMALVLADRPGTLTASPPPMDTVLSSGVHFTHERLRAIGTRAPLYNSHDDFLSSIHALGSDTGQVNATVDEFLNGNRWHVEPH